MSLLGRPLRNGRVLVKLLIIAVSAIHITPRSSIGFTVKQLERSRGAIDDESGRFDGALNSRRCTSTPAVGSFPLLW